MLPVDTGCESAGWAQSIGLIGLPLRDDLWARGGERWHQEGDSGIESAAIAEALIARSEAFGDQCSQIISSSPGGEGFGGVARSDVVGNGRIQTSGHRRDRAQADLIDLDFPVVRRWRRQRLPVAGEFTQMADAPIPQLASRGRQGSRSVGSH